MKSSTIPLLFIALIIFSTMCPIHQCYNMVKLTRQEETSSALGIISLTHPLVYVLPNLLCNFLVWTPFMSTMAPHTILHESLSKIVCTPTSSILLKYTRFQAKLGIWNTLGSVPLFHLSISVIVYPVQKYWLVIHLPTWHIPLQTFHIHRTNLCVVSYDKMH